MIKNYIQINQKFLLLDEIETTQFSKIDWEYVYGKINIYEVFEITDDINWFWGYVVWNFDTFFTEKKYEIQLPSQPITFQLFDYSSENILLKIFGENEIYVNKFFPKTLFIDGFLQAAYQYFYFEKKYSNATQTMLDLQKITEYIGKLQN